MTPAIGAMQSDRSQSNLLTRAVNVGACALGVGILFEVGWRIIAPVDPLGALTLVGRGDAIIMLIGVALLAMFVCTVVRAVVAPRMIDLGLFSVSLGLVAMSLRGASAQYLFLHDESANGSEGMLAVKFIFESVTWALVVLVALVASAWFNRRTRVPDENDAEGATGGATVDEAFTQPSLIEVALDIPYVSHRLLGHPAITHPVEGLKHAAIFAGVSVTLVVMMSVGLASRSIQHAQVLFVVAASTWAATHLAMRIVPVRSVFWSVVGVVLTVFAGYLWSAIPSVGGGGPPGLPTSPFLRILPIQYVAMGMASVVFTCGSLLAYDRADPTAHP